jgi:hypothetical protein
MSVNLPNHYVQQFSANQALLLQIKGSKLADKVTMGAYIGEQASPVDQYGAVEMQEVTGRFTAMPRVDVDTDRRWVLPSDWDLPQMIDTFDKLRLLNDPASMYVMNSVLAAGRQKDRLIIDAFVGTAKTGKSGSTNTSFAAANEVDVAVGGANSKLNVAKIKAVRELMEANFIDFETEEAYIGITAADHASLLNEIQVISSDFNGGAPVLQQGKIVSFLGFTFCQTELIEQRLAGTNEVTLPVWVKSGMHLGLWNDIQNTVSQRHDLRGEPWQIYTKMTAGATRLEEDKVYAIESYRA